MAKTLVVYYSQSRGNTKRSPGRSRPPQVQTRQPLTRCDPTTALMTSWCTVCPRQRRKTRSARPSSPWTRTRHTMTALCWAPHLVVHHGPGCAHFLNRNRSDRQRVGPVCHPRRLARPCAGGHESLCQGRKSHSPNGCAVRLHRRRPPGDPMPAVTAWAEKLK